MNIDRRSVCAKAAAIVIGMYALSAQAYSGGSAADLVAQMTLEEKASLLQHDSPAIARLGIPAYNWWNEGLHGVAAIAPRRQHGGNHRSSDALLLKHDHLIGREVKFRA